MKVKKTMDHITEPARKTPIVATVDVVVVGGGVSGIIAAVAAARNGARTLLIERFGYLGGYFASGPGGRAAGTSFQDMKGNMIIKGLPWEMIQRLIAIGGAVGIKDVDLSMETELAPEGNVSYGYIVQKRHIGKTRPVVDYEAVKTLAFEMMGEGVKVLLHSWAVGAIVEEHTIKGVVVENKSGRQAILAKVVLDCTGDGDIAAHAGAPFEITAKEELYQMARSFRIAIRNAKGQPIIVGSIGASYDCGDGTDAWDLTKAEMFIRKRVMEQLRRIKRLPGYETCYLFSDGEPPQLGVRETRRIIGEHILTEEDIVEGHKFPDTIAKSANPIDLHKPGGIVEDHTIKTDYHDIPYRCLVPKKIDNLLVAGRCISATHMAEGATRKIPVCMATGQAAGTAAAVAAKLGIPPRRLDVELLQKTLQEQGAL